MKYLLILSCVPEGIELMAESIGLMCEADVDVKISAVITTESPEAAQKMTEIYGAYRKPSAKLEKKGKLQ
jgi:hypothetical protein